MRLAAELPGGLSSSHIEVCRRLGLTGIGFDVDASLDLDDARRLVAPFQEAGLTIVQLGCYRNLISQDPSVRAAAIGDVAGAMNVAGRLGIEAVVCGGGHMDPSKPSARRSVHRDNWTEKALNEMIESCHQIAARIDDQAAPLCFEPWVITSLNTPQRLERLVRSLDHPKFAVELDLANLVTVERYFDTAGLITECFERFGDKIRIVHLKDVVLTPEPYIYHVGEAVVGDGNIAYRVMLQLLGRNFAEASLMIEHLKSEDDARRAVDHMRSIAAETGVALS